MNWFDRMLENFSATALGQRVRLVVVIGILLCAGGAYAAHWFLTNMHALTAETVAHRVSATEAEIVVDPNDLALLARTPTHAAIIEESDRSAIPVTLTIRSVDPATERLRVTIGDLPAGTELPEHFRLRIVLEEKPYWQLLWGNRAVDATH